jgi:hypothetical protein
MNEPVGFYRTSNHMVQYELDKFCLVTWISPLRQVCPTLAQQRPSPRTLQLHLVRVCLVPELYRLEHFDSRF